ncbi:MAG: futalosine hydrolase [Ginsengibacter sp.]
MKLLVIAATGFEIKPFTENNKNADVLITGVGIPATIFHLTQQLPKKQYDLVIQAGIAGSFNTLELGSVAVIEKDTFGDIGIDEKGRFTTLFETGLAQENDFPYRNGWLVNEHDYFAHPTLPVAKAITVNKIIDDPAQVKLLYQKFGAGVESMEGAAFHYVCLRQKVKFLQLRSISNFAGERDKTKWKITEAITNLNIAIEQLAKNIL